MPFELSSSRSSFSLLASERDISASSTYLNQ
jgi:hypothetical protein